jgi:hypothetical protein
MRPVRQKSTREALRELRHDYGVTVIPVHDGLISRGGPHHDANRRIRALLKLLDTRQRQNRTRFRQAVESVAVEPALAKKRGGKR